MKKLIVWTVALCFVFSFSFVYAQPSKTEEPYGPPSEPTKTVKETKKARAAKKPKVKKDRGAKPVEPVVKDKSGASNPVEAPAGSPGEPVKSRQDVKQGK